MDILLMIFIFLLGIVIGSFLNVCIYRIPKEESIAAGGSSCQSCGSRLTAIDLVPILSYAALGGKCRHCKTKISMQYPIIEIITGIIYLLLYLKFGLSWLLPINLALTAVMIVITLIDFRHMIIPNGLVITGLVVGTAQLFASIFTAGVFESWPVYAIGFFAGGLPLFLIAAFCTYVLKKDAIGGGDIKLMAMAGLILGWKLLIPAYFIGILIGAVISIVLLATGRKKRGDEIPFGPSLCFGIVISVFFGSEIINWYIGMLL